MQEECDRLLRGSNEKIEGSICSDISLIRGVELNMTVAHMTARLEEERKLSEETIENSNKYNKECKI